MSSPQIGLKNLVYAIMSTLDDGVTVPVYSAPVKIADAISAKISPKTSTDPQWSDDGAGEIIQTLGVIDVELQIKDLPLSVQAALLGHTISAGVMVRKSTDIAPYVAIGYKARKSNGKFRYQWLYKGKFDVIEQQNETLADKAKVQNPVLKGTFVKRLYDDAWQKTADEDEIGYIAATGTNWFSYVDNASDVTPPTVSSVVPANAATSVSASTSITWNFSEAITGVNGGNFVLIKSTDGSIVSGTLATNGASTQVTFTPSSALTAATKYIAIVGSTYLKDANGNALAAPYSTTFTTA